MKFSDKIENIKHRVILVRHGESTTNQLYMNNIPHQKDINPHLTEIGKEQSQEVANFIYDTLDLNPNQIIVSPLNRTFETFYPFYEKYTETSRPLPKIIFDIDWSERNYHHNLDVKFNSYRQFGIHEYFYPKESSEEFNQRVVENYNSLCHQGTVENPIKTLIFTHSLVISKLMNIDRDHIFHNANCSITCIDIDEDNIFHLHSFGYTNHLSKITGNHTPLV